MKRYRFVFCLLIVWLLMGCAGADEQQVLIERNEVIGEHQVDSSFQEALAIKAIETWKDQPGKIVNVYALNPTTGELLHPVVRCSAVPTSSTESLEPNEGAASYYNGSAYGFPVRLEGQDIYTNEQAGRDGTFGDPIWFRECMTTDGQYYSFPQLCLCFVTSYEWTFTKSTVERDFPTEVRLLQAEEIIKRGGCVHQETLLEIECPPVETPPTAVPTTQP